ncbi:MAG: fibrobacter succinogenes major paralogous domain-containing protein [Bacteroidales bacterium]|jgi:uncharacterized protein (TIGR02145 family)
MKTFCKPLVFTAFTLLFFSGLKAQTVKDADGNTYNSVIIGAQAWMSENLRTTKLNDGTAIPLVTDNTAWSALNTPAFSWYGNDAEANKEKFGALYNWYTVSTNKLCPKGWHVPADAELTALTAFLGGESVAGGKLRESGTAHWQSPNAGATNSSDFSALPGGYRNNKGTFANIGFFASWWSSTENAPVASWAITTGCGNSNVIRLFSLKKNGYSVRCVKDY